MSCDTCTFMKQKLREMIKDCEHNIELANRGVRYSKSALEKDKNTLETVLYVLEKKERETIHDKIYTKIKEGNEVVFCVFSGGDPDSDDTNLERIFKSYEDAENYVNEENKILSEKLKENYDYAKYFSENGESREEYYVDEPFSKKKLFVEEWELE